MVSIAELSCAGTAGEGDLLPDEDEAEDDVVGTVVSLPGSSRYCPDDWFLLWPGSALGGVLGRVTLGR